MAQRLIPVVFLITLNLQETSHHLYDRSAWCYKHSSSDSFERLNTISAPARRLSMATAYGTATYPFRGPSPPLSTHASWTHNNKQQQQHPPSSIAHRPSPSLLRLERLSPFGDTTVDTFSWTVVYFLPYSTTWLLKPSHRQSRLKNPRHKLCYGLHETDTLRHHNYLCRLMRQFLNFGYQELYSDCISMTMPLI